MKKLKIFENISSRDCILFVLLFGFGYCFIHIGISTYQIFKDIYYCIGCCMLMLTSLVLRKVKLFTVKRIAFVAVAITAIMYYQLIHRADWGYQYAFMLISKHLLYTVFALTLWIMVEEHVSKTLRLRNSFLTIAFLVAGSAALILGQDYILAILMPMFVWYSTPFTKQEWKRTVTTLAIALYAVFAFYMTKSLVVMPNEYDGGRYIGLFVFPAIAGVVASLALISGFYLWKVYGQLIAGKGLRALVLILVLAYPLFSLVFVFNRASVLSIFVVILLMFVVNADKDRAKKARKRVIIIAAVAVALLIGELVAIKILQNSDLSAVQNYLANKGEDNHGLYIISRVMGTVTIKESRTGLFEPGTIMNALDTMSSTRVGIWYLGLKNVKLLGNSDLSVTLPNGDFAAHTHNTYLDMMLRLGIVGGALMIIWFLAYIITAARKYIKYDDTVLLTLMWSFFCIFFFFVERELWTNIPAFLLLVLQYPLLIKFKDEEEV